MAREIHIIYPEHLASPLLFDGPVERGKRIEYKTLYDLLENIPNNVEGLDHTRKIDIYIENFNLIEQKVITDILEKKLKKPIYHFERTRANGNGHSQ